jgi:hypothetical protein
MIDNVNRFICLVLDRIDHNWPCRSGLTFDDIDQQSFLSCLHRAALQGQVPLENVTRRINEIGLWTDCSIDQYLSIYIYIYIYIFTCIWAMHDKSRLVSIDNKLEHVLIFTSHATIVLTYIPVNCLDWNMYKPILCTIHIRTNANALNIVVLNKNDIQRNKLDMCHQIWLPSKTRDLLTRNKIHVWVCRVIRQLFSLSLQLICLLVDWCRMIKYVRRSTHLCMCVCVLLAFTFSRIAS